MKGAFFTSMQEPQEDKNSQEELSKSDYIEQEKNERKDSSLLKALIGVNIATGNALAEKQVSCLPYGIEKNAAYFEPDKRNALFFGKQLGLKI